MKSTLRNYITTSFHELEFLFASYHILVRGKHITSFYTNLTQMCVTLTIGRVLVPPCGTSLPNARVLDSQNWEYHPGKCLTPSGYWRYCLKRQKRGKLKATFTIWTLCSCSSVIVLGRSVSYFRFEWLHFRYFTVVCIYSVRLFLHMVLQDDCTLLSTTPKLIFISHLWKKAFVHFKSFYSTLNFLRNDRSTDL